MNTLQLSPISGTSATAAGASPTGEAVASSHPKTLEPPQPAAKKPAQTAAATSTHAQQQAAAAENQQADARITTPSLDLNVGLVRGTFDVYVDLTDRASNRVVARVYGPRGTAPEVRLTSSKVRTEA